MLRKDLRKASPIASGTADPYPKNFLRFSLLAGKSRTEREPASRSGREVVVHSASRRPRCSMRSER